MARFFAEPEHWRVSSEVFAQSLSEMALDGVMGNEGVAMWLGRYEGNVAIVSHLGVLRGPYVRKEPDLLMIDSELINDLTDLAITNNVRLIGQIHSHAPKYGTDLSETDRRYGVAVPGMLSLVAPDYALRKGTTLIDCGVHVFLPGEGWRRLPSKEVTARLSLFDGGTASILAAGAP
jgi:proteasome lid subunit RPN8/RPN11